ncbi:MAG: hypothetical protein Kow0020_12400 [Wenzhouxiangellaceae bacterium]
MLQLARLRASQREPAALIGAISGDGAGEQGSFQAQAAWPGVVPKRSRYFCENHERDSKPTA